MGGGWELCRFMCRLLIQSYGAARKSWVGAESARPTVRAPNAASTFVDAMPAYMVYSSNPMQIEGPAFDLTKSRLSLSGWGLRGGWSRFQPLVIADAG